MSEYSEECLASFSERFRAKVFMRGMDECWPWASSQNGRGYGAFWDGIRMGKAHRISYQMAFGPVQNGLVIRHRCDNKVCVNPLHLEPGTHQDNMADMAVRERHRTALQTHCKNGHELPERDKNRRRICGICDRAAKNKSQRAIRAAKRNASNMEKAK